MRNFHYQHLPAFMFCSHSWPVYSADLRWQVLTEELVHTDQYLHGAVQRRQHQPRQTAFEIWQVVTFLQASIKSVWCQPVHDWYSGGGSLWGDYQCVVAAKWLIFLLLLQWQPAWGEDSPKVPLMAFINVPFRTQRLCYRDSVDTSVWKSSTIEDGLFDQEGKFGCSCASRFECDQHASKYILW